MPQPRHDVQAAEHVADDSKENGAMKVTLLNKSTDVTLKLMRTPQLTVCCLRLTIRFP
jgi:hypothetical protein